MSTSTKNPSFRVGGDPGFAEHLAEILKALAHPTRLRIVAILIDGPHHVNGLAKRLGVNQSIVSQQLRILRLRHLVRVVRSEGRAYYHLAEPELKTLLQCMESCSVPH